MNKRRNGSRMAVGLLIGLASSSLAGCGDSADESGSTAPSAAVGGAISLAELLETAGDDDPGETVLVSAVLFDDGSGLQMCEALAESYPPQCAGARIDARDEVAADVEFSEAEGVRWTEGAVELLGWIENGEFVVS